MNADMDESVEAGKDTFAAARCLARRGDLPLPTVPSEWPPVALGAEPVEQAPWHMPSGAEVECCIRLVKAKTGRQS